MTAGSRRQSAGPFALRAHPVTALVWAALGALLVLLLSQVPAAHRVDIGGYDAAYVQGFHEPERPSTTGDERPELAGSNGAARWSRPSAALLFPQAGLPGSVTVRLRGWRAAGPPPEVVLLLNGTRELARFQASGDWEEHRLAVTGGWLKASDFFVELRATPAALPDGRDVGVLVDSVAYTTGPGPTLPFPAQMIYGAAVGALLWTLLGRATGGSWPVVAGLLAYGLAWLLLYRLQPPLYPYPLRSLPPLTVLGLAALLTLRDGPTLAARAPWLVSKVAPALVVAGWTAATLIAARGHVTLARPGVENDFRVFATRETLPQIFSADGFYNLGYPLLLWLARPLAEGNAFLAGRLLAALCGAALLAAGYWLARTLLPPGPALLALLALALNAFVAQYGLYVGSDMPFAACVTLCVAALGAWLQTAGARSAPRYTEQSRLARELALLAAAGMAGGAAFLMRHLGLVLLPWGLLVVLAVTYRRTHAPALLDPPVPTPSLSPVPSSLLPLTFALAFILAMAPQLVVNTLQAGQPLYNQQAKNIWLAVYGGTDWGRWEEAPNSIGLVEVVLQDPARFLENWWRNMVGYTGSGAEDTSEFGRALQLRLLGWPANWLAAGGLLAWIVLAIQRWARGASAAPAVAARDSEPGDGAQPRDEERPRGNPLTAPAQARVETHAAGPLAFLLLIALYVAAVSTAFTLQRFFLPLAPLYAVAAGWTLWRLARGGRALLGAGLTMVVVLWGGFGAGANYVLAGQPADEVAAVAMVERALPDDALLAARVAGRLPLAKYSAIGHRVVAWPVGSELSVPITAADLAAARTAGANYLLWDEAGGLPPLADPEAARVASSGRYALYRLNP